MAEIRVVESGPGTYSVTVVEGATSTTHNVSADGDTIDRLAPGTDPELVVAASFRFLLDREPKEAILSSFDLPLISTYFPEYEARLRSYLEG